MDDSWDTENFEPPALSVPKGDKWEGEDEDDDVKDNWEDEEEEKKDEEKQEIKQKAVPLIKKKKTLVEKIEEKERKEREEVARKLAAKEAMKNLTPEEKMAEKLRQQRLQEEADLQVTKETFGVIETSSDSIDALNPSTQEEFNLLQEAILKKLQPLATSVHYPTFVEDLTRNICAGLTASNIKKLKVAIDTLYTEKQKAEKEKGPSKKGLKGRPQIKMEGKSDFGYHGAAQEDDFDW